MAKLLTKLKINSVASVDRGAGEGVRVVLMKRDSSAGDKRETTMFEKILKVFIGDRVAKAKDALNESVQSIINDDTVENKSEMIKDTIKQFGAHLTDIDDDVAKALAAGDAVDEDGATDMSPEIKKALGLADNATDEDVLKAVNATVDKAKKAPAKDDGEPDGDEVEKAALPESVKKKLEEAELLKKRVDDLVAANELVGFNKRAADLNLPEADGATIQKAYQGDKDSIDKLLGYLKSAQAAAKEAGLFKEFGGTGRSDAGSAYEQLMAKAKELQKSDPNLTQAQAFSKAYTNPDNASLVSKHKDEEARKAA